MEEKKPEDGVQKNPVTDRFTQNTFDEKVDIVWMIDNSGSMDEEQVNIETNAKIFTDQLPKAIVDYRMIVITADASEGCKSLQSACRTIADSDGILSSSAMSPDEITSRFRSCVMVGEDGNGAEEGIEAARRALDPNYDPPIEVHTDCTAAGATEIVSGVRNPNFLRDDAHLHIIFVSDEEDEVDAKSFTAPNELLGLTVDNLESKQKELRAEMTPSLSFGGTRPEDCDEDNCEGRDADGHEAYFPLLKSHKDFFVDGLKGGRSDLFTAHAIVIPRIDDSDDCHSRTNDEEVGQRYMNFAQLTGGSFADACNPNWGPAMRSIGLQAAGLARCFSLSQPLSESNPPSITKVVVSGNEKELGAHFSYEGGVNRICFGEIPPAHAKIEITYY